MVFDLFFLLRDSENDLLFFENLANVRFKKRLTKVNLILQFCRLYLVLTFPILKNPTLTKATRQNYLQI